MTQKICLNFLKLKNVLLSLFLSSTIIWYFIWKRIKIARHESRSFVWWHVSLKCVVPLSRSLCIHIAKISRVAARATRSRSFHERLSSRPVRFSSRLHRITGANWISRRILKASPAGDPRFTLETKRDSPRSCFYSRSSNENICSFLDQFHSRGSDFFFFFFLNYNRIRAVRK